MVLIIFVALAIFAVVLGARENNNKKDK